MSELNRQVDSNVDRIALFDLDLDALVTGEAGLVAMGEPKYRGPQILEWVYARGATSFDEMTNLPVSLRTQLAKRFSIYESTLVDCRQSTDGTQKLLLRWPDGATTECVMIPDQDRRTLCVSSQVGCPVGCVFCASGLGGLDRQLTRAQIVEQAMTTRRVANCDRLTNIVFMGSGEPLHNYDAVVAAIRTINAGWGMNIAARKITVSTVGLPKQIKRLADERMQITLAISLHAPNDALRREIIPWAEAIDIAALIDSAKYYFAKTGREITVEYILLGGVNDHTEHARELSTVAKRMRANVNLIRYNPISELPYDRPTSDTVHRFQKVLRERGINAHVRKSRGLDIDGACGQLRRRHESSHSISAKVEQKKGASGTHPA